MTTIAGNPDLYGPFWVPTTVIFCLFAGSTIAESIAQTWSGKKYNAMDIKSLSFAAGTVYSYVLALPAIIYFTAKYYKANSILLFDLINIYGFDLILTKLWNDDMDTCFALLYCPI
jgi:hypothetical protein